MSERSFTHLHTHTEFSMLDGAARVGDLVAAAVADGQPALGITDHGNMYGVLDFYKACRDQGIVPIIGTEAYMAGESRHERPVRRGRVDDTGGDVEGGQKLYYHLTLLAETVEGYRNLMQLSSAAYLEGYYYKPRVDWELLERHHTGLIATTGCLGGVVLQALLAGDVPEAERRAARLQDIFGRDNLFVELQDHGIADQHRTNPQLIEIARRLDAPLLATNDSHYTHREDAVAHDALLCVQTGALLSDTNRFKFDGTEHYLKTAAEMRHLFRDVPEACDNTLLIAERADVQIELGKPSLPEFPVPDRFTRRHLRGAGTGLPARPHLGGGAPALRRLRCPREVEERLDYELGVIGNMGFAAYFLVVWDLIRFARESGIRVGPGPRVGGRLLRGLLPAHRGPRPDPLRPPLRALPQPGPQADARHRHGLRRALPRRRHALRGGEVRQRPGGPGHHVLDDQGAGRRARRGPGARQALRRWATASPRRCRRSSWAATPRCSLPHQDRRPRGRLRRGRRAARHARDATPTPRRSSTSRSASRDCAARTASTPPRWSSPGTR